MSRHELRPPVFNLPRGRFTDALVALTFVVSMLQFAPVVAGLLYPHAFSPALVLAGEWRDPVAWLSPVVSQFLLPEMSVNGVLFVIFNTVLLLIAGRYVEKSIGPVGLGLTFLAGAYGGSVARMALTPFSPFPTLGSGAALFAVIGAYLMLYGVPRAIPIGQQYSRPVQIAVIAAIWTAFHVLVMLVSGGAELSVSLVNPLGGLLAGALIARPLLRWRWRKA